MNYKYIFSNGVEYIMRNNNDNEAITAFIVALLKSDNNIAFIGREFRNDGRHYINAYDNHKKLIIRVYLQAVYLIPF